MGTVSERLAARAFSRRMSLRLISAAAVPLLAACGGTRGSGGGDTPSAGHQGFAFSKPVAITYWKSLEGPRHDAQVKLTDDFNASRSDIKVTLEHVGTYAQATEKLAVALAGGTPPDVVMLTADTFMPGYARRGVLYPLDSFARNDKSAAMDTYVSGFIKNGTINGKLYQLPFARSTPLLYLNRDHFATAGLAETPPSTWDQLLDLSQRITRAAVPQPDSSDQQRRAMGVAVYWWPLQSAVWAFGGRLSDDRFNPSVTQAETMQAMQFFADLIERYSVARGYTTTGRFQTAFVQGQTSFLMESTAQLSQIEQTAPFRVGAAFMPSQKDRAVPSGGSGLSIIESIPQERREAGWEYMKFMTNTPNTVYWSIATGYMVVRTDALGVPDYQKHLAANPNARVTFDQMQYVRTQDSIAEVPQAPQTIEAAMRQILIERKPVKATFEELQRQLTILAQEAPK